MSHRSHNHELPRPIPFGLLVVLAIAAVCGFVLSLSVTVVSARHAIPAGCGPGAGCGQVLGSRWSHWFGLPVAVLGTGIYLVILSAIPRPHARRRLWHRRLADPALLIATAFAAIAAPWFLLLQITALGTFCKYCLAIHACGVVCAAIVWYHAGRRQRRLLPWAGVGLAVLIAGEMFPSPHPYTLQAGVIADAPQARSASAPAPQPDSEPAVVPIDHHVRFVAGNRLFDLDPATLPVLGSPGARHFIVVMSDYTCEHCRVTHRMLERSLPLFGDEAIGVIVLPMLLDPASNPYLPPGVMEPAPQDAALTRLALAVFCTKPEAFGEMNRWLFAKDRIRSESEARAYATKLIGAEALEQAERDPRIREIMLTGCELFARTGNGAIPKMLVGTTMIVGPIEDASELRGPIRREWGGGVTSSAGETRTRD